MTRYLLVIAAATGLAYLGYALVRWLFGYQAHVPHPQFRKDFAKLPEPKKGRAA